MLWDQGFESWQSFGITRQPAAILVDPQGKELARYQGELTKADEAEIVRRAKAA